MWPKCCCTGLESRHRVKPTGSSNLPLSASQQGLTSSRRKSLLCAPFRQIVNIRAISLRDSEEVGRHDQTYRRHSTIGKKACLHLRPLPRVTAVRDLKKGPVTGTWRSLPPWMHGGELDRRDDNSGILHDSCQILVRTSLDRGLPIIDHRYLPVFGWPCSERSDATTGNSSQSDRPPEGPAKRPRMDGICLRLRTFSDEACTKSGNTRSACGGCDSAVADDNREVGWWLEARWQGCLISAMAGMCRSQCRDQIHDA